MAGKKRASSISRVLIKLMLVVPSIYHIARNLVFCLEQDAIAAKKGLMALAMLFLFALSLIIGTWFCICGMIFFWLITLQVNFIVISLILLMIHIIALFITALLITKSKHKLTFPHTRDLLH